MRLERISTLIHAKRYSKERSLSKADIRTLQEESDRLRLQCMESESCGKVILHLKQINQIKEVVINNDLIEFYSGCIKDCGLCTLDD